MNKSETVGGGILIEDKIKYIIISRQNDIIINFEFRNIN
ncbi:hypothetical protein LM701345_60335 [Listeria monocytogenes]|nr:hypothetical protein LM701345_60335 [Listeria monocytogenes]